jgi:hypothetical protein
MCCTQPYTRHRRRQARKIPQHYMCWTQPYTRHRTKTNKTNNNTICDGHNHTQDTDDDKQEKYHNTICVGHNHTQDTDDDKQDK